LINQGILAALGACIQVLWQILLSNYVCLLFSHG